MEVSEISPNYRYWQENGAFWVEEYSRRKRTQVYFDIQEFMLAEYFGHCAPARVLEFGCGVGRHLKYLRHIHGIEIYGYDQSPSMVEGVRQWADEAWFREHITLGEPVTHLPYQDKSFDIVFTTEVLIHVRPDDLPAILAEFLRISKWQIYHLEPAPDFVVVPDAHDGCWNHDLVLAYGNLGYTCEILPKGYRAQSPYRVLIDKSRSVPPSIISMGKLLELEENIQPTIDKSEKRNDELKKDFEQRSSQYEIYLEEARKRDKDWQVLVDELKQDFEQRTTRYEMDLEEARKRDKDWQALVDELKKDFEQRITQYEMDLEEARKRDKDWQVLVDELKKDFEQRTAHYGIDLEDARKQSILLKTETDNLVEVIRDKQLKLECLNAEVAYVDTLLTELKARKIGRITWWRSIQTNASIKIIALGKCHPSSQGSEVWILSIKNSQYPYGIPLKHLPFNPKSWTLTEDNRVPFGYSLVAVGKAQLSIPLKVDETLQIGFLSHSWSGLIGIEVQGKMTIVDLYNENHRGINIFPYHYPLDITE
jgi:SAM-dependent methyltransferase